MTFSSTSNGLQSVSQLFVGSAIKDVDHAMPWAGTSKLHDCTHALTVECCSVVDCSVVL